MGRVTQAKCKAKRQAKGKPKNRTEARAWLQHHSRAHPGRPLRNTGRTSRPYRLPDGVSLRRCAYAAHQWLSDVRCLRWFADAVKAFLSEENKKSLGQFLGLEKGRGNPGGRRKSGESLELSREISEQRETKSKTRKTRQGKPARTSWKEVGRDHGDMSDQAARKRAKRASQVRAEDEAKEFAVARLKQRLEQKPPRVGKAKARNEALVKEIRAHNRRKR